jgi:hypothetical protein
MPIKSGKTHGTFVDMWVKRKINKSQLPCLSCKIFSRIFSEPRVEKNPNWMSSDLLSNEKRKGKSGRKNDLHDMWIKMCIYERHYKEVWRRSCCLCAVRRDFHGKCISNNIYMLFFFFCTRERRNNISETLAQKRGMISAVKINRVASRTRERKRRKYLYKTHKQNCVLRVGECFISTLVERAGKRKEVFPFSFPRAAAGKMKSFYPALLLLLL